MSAVLEARERSARYLAGVQPTLLRHFKLLATAPNGVARLRQLILKLAVLGNLLPHRGSGLPAASCGNGTPAAGADEVLAPLPEGWRWTSLGEVVDVLDSQRKPVKKEDRKPGPYPYFGASGIVDHVAAYIFDEPLVLVGEDGAKWGAGDATAFLISGKSWVNNHAHVLRPNREKVADRYLVIVLTAKDLSPYVTGMTVPKLNQGRLVSIPIPLPPLLEQARIVTRVDELMRLCDALEAQGRLEAEQHARLLGTLLGTLTDSSTPEELAADWQRVADHFDLLLDRPEAVDALEQTILQLAVRGLLVPQDQNDEPASVLLERIRAERDRLIAAGKVKRDKPLPPASDEDPPYELPDGWAWARLGSLGITSTGGTPPTNRPECFGHETPFIGPGQISARGEILPAEKFISELGRFETSIAERGDVLMVCIGGSIGKCAITPEVTAFNQQINSIRVLFGSSSYVLAAMTSLGFQRRVLDASTGSATPIISKGKWDLLLLPVPPAAEQSRIVARVEELRHLCTALRQRLAASQTTQSRLAEAMVEVVT